MSWTSGGQPQPPSAPSPSPSFGPSFGPSGPAYGLPAVPPPLGLRSGASAVLFVVLVGLALVLGGAPSTAPSTPVDPGSDAFVVDFVGTTSDVPLADPAARAALLPVP